MAGGGGEGLLPSTGDSCFSYKFDAAATADSPSPGSVVLAQVGIMFSQLPCQCPLQSRSANGWILNDIFVHPDKLPLIVVSFLFNMPLDSVG